MAPTTTNDEQASDTSYISEADRKKIRSELAVMVCQLEEEMDRILDEFDMMDNSIEKMLNITEKRNEVAGGIYDCGATSGGAAIKDLKDLEATGKASNKKFIIPNDEAMAATEKYKTWVRSERTSHQNECRTRGTLILNKCMQICRCRLYNYFG